MILHKQCYRNDKIKHVSPLSERMFSIVQLFSSEEYMSITNIDNIISF